ncbi:hypothetical protein Dimus_039043 [Dionaea muscipula]
MVDYEETFFPVTKIGTVCILLSLAATFRWPLFQLDVKNTFLHDDLHEEVYMTHLLGSLLRGSSLVRCLRKALYSLKQSPIWLGLGNSVMPYYSLGCTNVSLTILSFSSHPPKGESLLCML